ncbi:MAG: transposase [Pyrinomonadaceae bacterium]
MQEGKGIQSEKRIVDRRGRYDRGYLPHYDNDVLTQFVTFRLAGSLPKSVVAGLSRNLERGLISEIDFHREIDKYLDMSDGLTYLSDERIAESISETILKFDRVKYELHSWVIMPNHVHILITPLDDYSLAEILHSIKSFTANFANKTLGRNGRFWSPEYFDRFIRDREHYASAKRYIENNPVKAGLCKEPEDWRWSSVAKRD